ncbi:MAG TPA: AAA family ATPase [Candidatus Saccharimonadales bacterium]
MNIQVIGVAGTNGSGKDTVMQLLSSKYHYLFVSATDLLAAELTKRGEPTDREHKSALSAEWRREDGMGVIVQKAYETWQEQASTYKGVVVGSLRHPGEADVVHELGGTMVWVDADPQVRYDRIQANVAARNRLVEDGITFEEFLAQEEREMHPVGDAATLDMASVKARCDVFLDNGGDDLISFQAAAEQALGLTASKN